MAFIDHITEDVVHKCLECGWGIAKAESHNCGFIQTQGCLESCFVFVAFPDMDVVISPSDIQLGKVPGATQFVNEFWDKG